MKRNTKLVRSRKTSPVEQTSSDGDIDLDFDKNWNEPLFSVTATRIILFSILTIVLIGLCFPGTARYYIDDVSKILDHSFHGNAIKNIVTFVKSTILSFVYNDDKVTSQHEIQGNDDDDDEEKLKYKRIKITNDDDYVIKGALDKADALIMQDKLNRAQEKFDDILDNHPDSPRARHGKAFCLFRMAESQKSNKLLEQSIQEYEILIRKVPNVPPTLLFKAGKKLAQLQSFRGWRNRAVATIEFILQKFPDNLELLRTVGVLCLENGADTAAKKYFMKILTIDTENRFAQVHMGFIMNHLNKDYQSAIEFFREGLKGTESEIHHGRFYIGYGNSLYMTNKLAEAYEVYKKGAEKGAFPSQWQRSTYNCEVTSQPWWTKKETKAEMFLNHLEDNWETIRDEALQVLDEDKGKFLLEREGLIHYGEWTEYFLYSKGIKNENNCALVPKTCEMLAKYQHHSSCTRGQIKFSLVNPNSHIYPHTGPSNCRIRAHLGLVVPQDGGTPVIRVGHPDSGFKTWKEGQFIIFDDSFEHEVWHNGTSLRMVLIVDMWHPDVSEMDRKNLSPI